MGKITTVTFVTFAKGKVKKQNQLKVAAIQQTYTVQSLSFFKARKEKRECEVRSTGRGVGVG